MGAQAATFGVGITVLPTLKIISSETSQGGTSYTIITNMKTVSVGGQEFSFDRPGQYTVFVKEPK